MHSIIPIYQVYFLERPH